MCILKTKCVTQIYFDDKLVRKIRHISNYNNLSYLLDENTRAYVIRHLRILPNNKKYVYCVEFPLPNAGRSHYLLDLIFYVTTLFRNISKDTLDRTSLATKSETTTSNSILKVCKIKTFRSLFNTIRNTIYFHFDH